MKLLIALLFLVLMTATGMAADGLAVFDQISGFIEGNLMAAAGTITLVLGVIWGFFKDKEKAKKILLCLLSLPFYLDQVAKICTKAAEFLRKILPKV